MARLPKALEPAPLLEPEVPVAPPLEPPAEPPTHINMAGDGVNPLQVAARNLGVAEADVLEVVVTLFARNVATRKDAATFRCKVRSTSGRPVKVHPETWHTLVGLAKLFDTTPEQLASLVAMHWVNWLYTARKGSMLDYSPWFIRKTT